MTLTATLFDGLEVVVDERTARLGGAFYFDPLRAYSPEPLKWCYEQLIRYPKATLIDVGASTGCYSLLAKYHPGLTVHAFEPVELTHEVLTENIRLNKLKKQVKVNRLAISDYNGVGILHTVIYDANKAISIVDGKPAWHKAVEDSKIDVTTIDEYCALHKLSPTFLKIDTEGNEKAVLRGAKKTIEKYHPFILLEYSSENADQFEGNVNENIEWIESWGYVWRNPYGTDLWCVPVGWENIHKVQQVEGED